MNAGERRIEEGRGERGALLALIPWVFLLLCLSGCRPTIEEIREASPEERHAALKQLIKNDPYGFYYAALIYELRRDEYEKTHSNEWWFKMLHQERRMWQCLRAKWEAEGVEIPVWLKIETSPYPPEWGVPE